MDPEPDPIPDEQARIAKLEAEVLELRRQIAESDEIRGAIVSASTDLAFDTAVAMGRIEQLTKLADAALEWKHSILSNDPDRVVKARLNLNRLIDAYEAAKARRS